MLFRPLLTPLAEFAAPRLSRQTAYARPRFLSPEQRRASARHAAAQAGRPFRLTARTEQPYYCTILLLDAVRTQAPAFNPPFNADFNRASPYPVEQERLMEAPSGMRLYISRIDFIAHFMGLPSLPE